MTAEIYGIWKVRSLQNEVAHAYPLVLACLSGNWQSWHTQ